jgi:TatD DNase family protein
MGLGALVFAVTRSLDEAETALNRRDEWTVWGVGCHPSLVGAQRAFEVGRFAALVERTPFVSEIGLDGTSRVPMPLQRQRLGEIFSVLQSTPRITSIHSFRATSEILAELEARPISGAVLHWWLGDQAQTARAIELGCYFSVNASSLRHRDLLEMIPIERIFSETDHPFGDRNRRGVRRPGAVEDVELRIATFQNLAQDVVRLRLWRNLAILVSQTGTAKLLHRSLRTHLASV